MPALDTNGPRRTSTGESLSALGLAGLQPARVGALWAFRTSTGEGLSAVGLAGLQPAIQKMSERM